MKNIHTLMQYNKNYDIRKINTKRISNTAAQLSLHVTTKETADVTLAQRYSSPSDKVRWHLNHSTKTTL